MANMQLLQEKLRVLEEEKALAPDEDEDRTAGGRRVELLPAVLISCLWIQCAKS